MDGENKGKPYEQMEDLGIPLFTGSELWSWADIHVFGWFSPEKTPTWIMNVFSTWINLSKKTTKM